MPAVPDADPGRIIGPGLAVALVIDLLVASIPLFASMSLSLPSGPLMPYRLVIVALAGLAIWRLTTGRRVLVPGTLAIIGVVGGCFLVFGSIAAIRFRTSHLDEAVNVGLLLGLAASLAVLSGSRRTVSFLLCGWLLTGLASLAVAAWELTTGLHLATNTYAAGTTTDQTPPAVKTGSFFDNPNLFAYQCDLLVVLLGVAAALLPRKWRYLTAPLGVLIVALLTAMDSRLALVAALLTLAAWAWRTRRGRVALAAAVLAVAGILAATGLWSALATEVSDTAASLQTTGSSGLDRLELIRAGTWMAAASSGLGVGPGGFADWALRPDNPFPAGHLTNPHSGVIEVLSGYGVVTLVAVGGALAAAAVAGLAASRRALDRTDRALGFAAFLFAALWPIISASHSTWLRQPLSGAHVATLVALVAWVQCGNRRGRSDLEAANPSSALADDEAPDADPRA